MNYKKLINFKIWLKRRSDSRSQVVGSIIINKNEKIALDSKSALILRLKSSKATQMLASALLSAFSTSYQTFNLRTRAATSLTQEQLWQQIHFEHLRQLLLRMWLQHGWPSIFLIIYRFYNSNCTFILLAGTIPSSCVAEGRLCQILSEYHSDSSCLQLTIT